MDNPGISLFQGTDININNSQNNEEDEDLEDQIRRKEELQNLLQANLDDFKYDESTINSSTNLSLASVDHYEQNYKDAITPNEQLKVLYDVRVREIQALREEYNRHVEETRKEIDSLKHKNILLESEMRQAKTSLANAEVLLVEKAQTINNLNNNLSKKECDINNLNKIVKENEDDLATYRTELAELHLKFQSQNGPFNLNARFNSEEYQKSLQEKINKLENELEQERDRAEHLNKEKVVLEEELQRLVVEKSDLEKDSCAILLNFDKAQAQCKDLISLVEALRKENGHFKDRVKQSNESHIENLDYTIQKSLDSGLIMAHNEKLRKMLLDKSIEIETLISKARYYEQDLPELMEYRQLKADIYKKEFQKCNNPNHTKDLLILQNDLQNYRRIIDDKNQQILTLNSNNKDLKEKIEEMLFQTRNEIQNISSKYNVPKLEVMSKELEKSESTVKQLSEKLEESEERRMSLLKKLQKQIEQTDAGVVTELEKCKNELRETRGLLTKERDENMMMSKDLEQTKNEVLKLKTQLEQLQIAKAALEAKKKDLNEKKEYEQLREQLVQVMNHLKNNQPEKESSVIVQELKQQMDQFLKNIQTEVIEKSILEEKIQSWHKLIDDITLKDPDEVLKSQYQDAVNNLHSSNEKLNEKERLLTHLRIGLDKMEKEKELAETELSEAVTTLQQAELTRKTLENEIDKLKMRKSSPRKKNSDIHHQLAEVLGQLQYKEAELITRKEKIKLVEEEKRDLKRRIDKMKSEMEQLKNDNLALNNDLLKAKEHSKTDNHELRNVSLQVTMDKSNDFSNNKENDVTLFNDKLTRAELQLRDEIQIEYQKRINEIEKRYKSMSKDIKDVSKQYEEKLEQQEKQYREYLKMILKECEKCLKETENEKLRQTDQLKLLREDFEQYKKSVLGNEEKYIKMLRKKDKEAKKTIQAWKLWSKEIISSCLDIEATNKKVRDRVFNNLTHYDLEVAAIQKAFEAKMEKKGSKK